jgi:hypothetical protein
MRKNRATRLANRVGSVEELFMLIAPLKTAADKAEGRDKLPTRRKVETHFAAIEILTAREATAKLAETVKKASGKKTLPPQKYADGAVITLKANKAEGWKAETVTIVGYEGNGMYLAKGRKAHCADDGLVEIHEDQIQKPSPKK